MENEKWVQLSQYNPRYWVSNYGNLKSIYPSGRTITLNSYITPFGYNRVQLRLLLGGYKNVFVHVLVAKAFIENPENKEMVNHKNSVRTDNNAGNLEWTTRSENYLHGFKFGFMCKKGERSSGNIVTEAQAIEIFYSTKPTRELVKEYGLTKSGIYNIKKGVSWKHLGLKSIL